MPAQPVVMKNAPTKLVRQIIRSHRCRIVVIESVCRHVTSARHNPALINANYFIPPLIVIPFPPDANITGFHHVLTIPALFRRHYALMIARYAQIGIASEHPASKCEVQRCSPFPAEGSFSSSREAREQRVLASSPVIAAREHHRNESRA